MAGTIDLRIYITRQMYSQMQISLQDTPVGITPCLCPKKHTHKSQQFHYTITSSRDTYIITIVALLIACQIVKNYERIYI